MPTSLMEYKGYHAKIEFDQEDQIFVGQVIGINDSIGFHGGSVAELTDARPEQHRKLALHAANEGITINQLVARAIDDELSLLEG